jgi:hypothetical protein
MVGLQGKDFLEGAIIEVLSFEHIHISNHQ